jgi:hypothetical protein
MATISQLQKLAKTAPKFVLVGTYQGKTCYIREDQTLTSLNLTTSTENARKFSVGFDDENMKSRAWSMTAKLAGLETKFTPLYL